MPHYEGRKKKKGKTVPAGMPKHMDNPNSTYERKTDYKLGKQTMQYITKQDFERMQRACLVHAQKAARGSNEEFRWYRNYVILMCGVNLGFRTTTILEITPRSFAGGRLWIKEHKTGKVIQMTLKDSLYKLLDSYTKKYAFTRDEYIFRRSIDCKNRPLTRGTAWKFVTQLAEECGIDYNIGAYSLRKSYARWLYDETKDIFKVMRVIGHSDPIVTARYICLEDEEVQKLRMKIEYGFDNFREN